MWTCSRVRTTITEPKPRSRPRRSRCDRRLHRRDWTTCRPPRGRSVVIVASGVGNLRSIAGAFRRPGATPVVSADPAIVRDAARIVLPGVGAFGAGMMALRSRGLDTVIRERASQGTPILGICLGMQLLCDASEETPGVAGLGVIAGTCRRLPADVRIPPLRRDRVTPEPEAPRPAPRRPAVATSSAFPGGPAGWAGR